MSDVSSSQVDGLVASPPAYTLQLHLCTLSIGQHFVSVKTVVRTVYDNSNDFGVKVGMQQGSALSPLLFVIVMEALENSELPYHRSCCTQKTWS